MGKYDEEFAELMRRYKPSHYRDAIKPESSVTMHPVRGFEFHMGAKMTTVFVYGTLKRGYGNWARLLDGKSTFLGEAVTKQKVYRMHDVGFPVLNETGKHFVRGELYEVDAEVLERLDRLEGVPHHYRRETRNFLKIKLLDGLRNAEMVEAQIYLYPNDRELPGEPIKPRNTLLEWGYKRT